MKSALLLTFCALFVAACLADEKPLCICPRNYAPVCASDGETYSNECTFNCQRTRSAGLRMLGHGTCLEVLRNLNPEELSSL